MKATYSELPVTTLASGLELKLGVHEVNGDKPGPILGITAAIHGDEMIGSEIVRRVVERINPAKLAGTLRVMPVANPLAFEALTRNTPLDMNNMNRVFPGDESGWLTEKIAHIVANKFIKGLDFYVDLHAGGDKPVVDYVYLLNSEEMSRAFGSKIMYRPAASYPGSSSEFSVKLGIPTIVVELGGGPNGEDHVERGVKGVLNVMKVAAMLPANPEGVPKDAVVLKDMVTIRPKAGGIMVPETPDMSPADVITGHKVLARVYNPMTFQELEVISAPFEKNILVLHRGTVTRVHPGDYAYMIGNLETAF
jgi:uncharacterized protein